jgi:hypothetical protein
MRRCGLAVYLGVAIEEAAMNTTDMYSREKANQAHLDDMRRETKDGYLLRDAARAENPDNASTNRRLYLALAGAAVVALFAAFLIASAVSGLSIL